MESSPDYESVYRAFDSPLMRRVRREAYGEDIGQHSWVGADELRRDTMRLGLSGTSRLLDLGCGPCGPLTFVVAAAGCFGTGVDVSAVALRLGWVRAATLGVAERLTLVEADLDVRLPFEAARFDAAMSLDVVLHLRNRAAVFREAARLLRPAGRFLFTDAGVVTGALSRDEAAKRSLHGLTELVSPGSNEALLTSAGFRLIETEDRTASVVRNAGGRLAAIQHRRKELEEIWSAAGFEKQRIYLETVIELSRRGALSRMMYLAESAGSP